MQLPPQGSTQQGLSCVGLTEHFVVTGTKAGALCHYLVQVGHGLQAGASMAGADECIASAATMRYSRFVHKHVKLLLHIKAH